MCLFQFWFLQSMCLEVVLLGNMVFILKNVVSVLVSSEYVPRSCNCWLIWFFILKNVVSVLLGLCCCQKSFSSCGVRTSHCGPFSCYSVASGAQARERLGGLVTPRRVAPSRSRTCIPCIGRQILNHWSAREVHLFVRIS